MEDKHICKLMASERTLFRNRKTRYQKFLGYFRDMVLISEKNPRALLYFRSHKEIEAERQRQLGHKGKVIHPFSEFRIYLELVMIVVFLDHLVTASWDMFCDAVYITELNIWKQIYFGFGFLANLTDIVITFYTGYEIIETREVVIDIKRIRRRYSRSFLFFSDVVATVPLELIIGHLPYNHVHSIRWISVFSIIRLFRLPTTIIYLRNAADLWKISPILYRIIRYIIFSILILHWTSCMTVVISKYIYVYNLSRTHQNWATAAGINEKASYFKTYVTAFFRTTGQLMGITHGLYPNITIEDKLVTVFVFMSGYFLMGFILVLALQIITSQAVPEMINLAFLNQLKIYINRIKLPKAKQQNLISFYKYLFSENSSYDDETLKILSDELRKEIIMHSYRSVVKNVSIMAHFPQENIEIMLNYLNKEIYMPGQIIMKAGNSGDCMYFIIKGTVSLSTYYGIEVCHLHDGAYFGEIALILEDNRRTMTATALEISEICRLDRKHFNLCVSSESEEYKSLYEQAITRQEHLEELNKIHINRLYKKNMIKRMEKGKEIILRSTDSDRDFQVDFHLSNAHIDRFH